MKSLEQLERELATVNDAIDSLHKKAARTSGFAVNPVGEIGGIRSRSKRQKRKLMEKWDREVAELVGLYRRKRALESEIAALKVAPKREANQRLLDDFLKKTLKVGDMVWCGYPDPKRVVRINQKTVTVQCSNFLDRVPWSRLAPVERVKVDDGAN
ncbi:MAG: hypothetical protein FOGNACKC_00809 [Anaerolineae bacterium]|nr:hypothetical protein [Anaerolineae bacterium]